MRGRAVVRQMPQYPALRIIYSVGISFGMKYVVKLEWVAGVANDSDEVHVYHGDFNSTSNGTDKER